MLRTASILFLLLAPHATSAAPPAAATPAPAAAPPPAGVAPSAGVRMTREAVLAQMRALPGLEARYREEKHFALLAEPLVSTGTIHFMPPGRLVRKQLEPQPGRVVIEGQNLRVRDSHGSEQIDLQAQPVVGVFVASFMRLLEGDAAALDALYRTQFVAKDAGAWEITLRPRDESAAKLVERIAVRGRGAAVQRVEIVETGGDRTVMTFSDIDLERRYTRAQAQALLTGS